MEPSEQLQKKFRLITREEYRDCNISDNTKKILCKIGLPKQPLPFLRLDLADHQALENEENWWAIILE